MSNVSMGPIVANTKKSTDWAVRVIVEWWKQRNESQSDKCPLNLLESPSAGLLNCWLSRFATEAHHTDGDRYPSSTLYQLLASLLRYDCLHSKDCPSFLNRQEILALPNYVAHAKVFPEFCQSGIGPQVKHAATTVEYVSSAHPPLQHQLAARGAFSIKFVLNIDSRAPNALVVIVLTAPRTSHLVIGK